MMYAVMSILKYNVDIQKRGFVGIMYDIGLQEKDEAMMLGLAKFRHCLPLKLSAIHHCSDNQFVRAMFTIELIFMETYERVRYRGHFGTHMECQYSLHTFGQPKHGFPVSESGDYKLQQLMDLLTIFRKHEEAEARAVAAASASAAAAVTPEAVAGSARQPQHQQHHDSSCSVMSLNSGSERSNRSNFSNESSMMSRSGSPNDINLTFKKGNTISQRVGTPPLGPSSSTACSSRRKNRNPSIGSANSGGSGGGGGGGSGVFLVPQPSDVLLGRGKQIQEHSGNVRFRKLLDMHLQRYEQVGKYEKTEIAERKFLPGCLDASCVVVPVVFRLFVVATCSFHPSLTLSPFVALTHTYIQKLFVSLRNLAVS